jgi:hypothetical protein
MVNGRSQNASNQWPVRSTVFDFRSRPLLVKAWIAVLVALPALVGAQSALRVDKVKLSPPAPVGEIDTDKMKGQPARLAWSADGTQLYLQMLEGEFGMPPKKVHHHVLSAADGKRQSVDAEPEWASAYWTEKSGQTSPDGPPLKIELKEEIRTEKSTSTPMGGALARGGTGGDTGTSAGDAVSAAYNQQQVRVITTLLHNTAVGLFEGTVLVPGRTFGWGPKGTKAIAYADPKNGRVMVMDDRGEKAEVAGSKDAILPAWSPDGKRIAWLQKDGKKKYVLQVARVEGM